MKHDYNNFIDTIYDKFNRSGYLIQRGKYYIFQPFILDDNTLPLYYRRTPLTIKKENFGINILVLNSLVLMFWYLYFGNKYFGINVKDIKLVLVFQEKKTAHSVFIN